MPGSPRTRAIPTSPIGGASDAAMSSPGPAPETRLLRSDVTMFTAPAMPADSGNRIAVSDGDDTSLMSEVGSSTP